jgi:hypothetical protein
VCLASLSMRRRQKHSPVKKRSNSSGREPGVLELLLRIVVQSRSLANGTSAYLMLSLTMRRTFPSWDAQSPFPLRLMNFSTSAKPRIGATSTLLI